MTKNKGKAIIGIALAAIMIASVFVAMVPTSARTGGDIDFGDVVYRGEKDLNVENTGVADGGTFFGLADSTADGGLMTVAENEEFDVPSTAKLGPYSWDSRNDETADIIVDAAEVDADVRHGGDSIAGKSVPEGKDIFVRAKPNFGGILQDATTTPGADGKLKIKFTDPDGVTTTSKIDASSPEVDSEPFNTTGWATGTWKVAVSTDKDTCNQLDVSSAAVEFTIRSEELVIEAAADEVGKGDSMVLKVNGNPRTYYYFAIESVVNDKEPEIQDTDDVKATGTGEGKAGKDTAAWIKTGSDGVADVKISTTGADERTYTMNVYYKFDASGMGIGKAWPEDDDDCTATTTWYKPAEAEDEDPEDDDYVDVEVTEATVIFDIPTSVVIGEEITIRGSINAGDNVDVLVEDAYIARGDDVSVDENKEFEVKWKTEGMTKGSYTIDVYIDCLEDDYDGIRTAGLDEDGKTSIRLVAGQLTASQPRNVVAEDDDYTVEGTATGVGMVDLVLIGPDGYPPTDPGFGVEYGLEMKSSSVDDDDEFSEDITMVDGVDTGAWATFVASPGRDGVYGSTDVGPGNLDDLIADLDLNLAGKDRDQILAILEDNTIAVAGSDDLLVALAFKVESGYIDLNPVEAVGVGEPLNLTGETNREPGTMITIDTFAGPMDLPVGITKVEWLTADVGVFTATIDTSDAVEGTYTLEADDGDGNTDTITVTIGAAAPAPTATPVPTVAPATPVPTVPPTVAPATPVPTEEPTPTPEEPGFEAVFAIAGLLAVAYLVLRIKK